MQKLNSGGRKSVCKSFDNRTPAVWFSLFGHLVWNSHITQSPQLVWTDRLCHELCAWRTIGMHNKEHESWSGILAPHGNSLLYCSSLPTFISPTVTRNNLHPENHPSFPPRWGLRLVHRSQHGRIWLADSDVSFEGRPRLKAGQAHNGWLLVLWNMILITKSFSCHILHSISVCAYDWVLKVEFSFWF